MERKFQLICFISQILCWWIPAKDGVVTRQNSILGELTSSSDPNGKSWCGQLKGWYYYHRLINHHFKTIWFLYQLLILTEATLAWQLKIVFVTFDWFSLKWQIYPKQQIGFCFTRMDICPGLWNRIFITKSISCAWSLFHFK